MKGHWKRLQAKWLKTKRWVLIVGAPGIGKTYHLRMTLPALFQKRQAYLDGSSDELVRMAMADILERLIGVRRGGKEEDMVLVVDEFHMLSEDMKKQLLNFARANTLVQVIMIANRTDLKDEELLACAFGEHEARQGIIKGRNTLSNMLRAFKLHLPPTTTGRLYAEWRSTVRFITLWLRVTRNLFGEELLSFRLCKDVLAEWNKTQEAVNLAPILQRKLALISADFVNQVVDWIFTTHKQEEDLYRDLPCATARDLDTELLKLKYNKIDVGDAPSNCTPLVHMLCSAAATDQHDGLDEGANAALPEFINERIATAYRFHPARRILTWILYMYGRAQVEVPVEGRKAMMEQLSNYSIIDLPTRFPDIQSKPGDKEDLTKWLEQWDLAYCDVDVGDLNAVRQLFTRGYGVNWTKFADHWQRRTITDVQGFLDLLSVQPNALLRVSAENLALLMRLDPRGRLAHIIANEVTTDVLETMQKDSKCRVNYVNVQRAALWQLYRMIEQSEQVPGKFTLEEGKTFDLQDVLIWASDQSDQIEVAGTRDACKFQVKLYLDLIAVSNSMADDTAGLCTLWSNFFSPFFSLDFVLKDPRKEAAPQRDIYKHEARALCGQVESKTLVDQAKEQMESHTVLNMTAMLQVVHDCFPPRVDWPAATQALCYLLHRRATYAHVETLFPFRHALLATVGPDVVMHMIEKELISPAWQATILRNGRLLPPSAHTHYKKFSEGLKRLHQRRRAGMWILPELREGQPDIFYGKIARLHRILFLSSEAPAAASEAPAAAAGGKGKKGKK